MLSFPPFSRLVVFLDADFLIFCAGCFHVHIENTSVVRAGDYEVISSGVCFPSVCLRRISPRECIKIRHYLEVKVRILVILGASDDALGKVRRKFQCPFLDLYQNNAMSFCPNQFSLWYCLCDQYCPHLILDLLLV